MGSVKARLSERLLRSSSACRPLVISSVPMSAGGKGGGQRRPPRVLLSPAALHSPSATLSSSTVIFSSSSSQRLRKVTKMPLENSPWLSS